MKRVAIVQARMGSARLPGKVLMDIDGQVMLERVINRLKRATLVERIIVATSRATADAAIVDVARTLGVETFRGEEELVLNRYYEAAKAAGAEVVVRVTADCPLIDPHVVDRVVAAFLEGSPRVDYATNVIHRTYPRGLDVEVVPFAVLERVWHEATERYHRVHVFPYVREHPERFVLLNVSHDRDYSSMRWTVDTADDLEFVRAVYHRLGRDDRWSWLDVVALLEREPGLQQLNAHVVHKVLQEG